MMGARVVEVLISLATVAVPVGAQSFLAWEGLERGPNAVGFSTATVVDATRTIQRPTDVLGRPHPGYGQRTVHVAVWYPALPGTGTEMTYGDYLPELAWDTGPDPEGAAERQVAELRYIQTVTPLAGPPDQPTVDRLRAQRVLARRDATTVPGRCPVLVYAPGMGYPAFDNSVLFEYLASHGLVVVSAPSIGPEARRMPGDALGLEAQTRDLEVLVGYVQTLPQADAERIGAAGFSWGGLPAALLTLRNARVRAYVSLDGVVRDRSSLTLVGGFLHFSPERLRVPTLVITTTPERAIPGFDDDTFLERASFAAVTRAVVQGADHHDLASLSSLLRRCSVPGRDRDWAAATTAYQALCRVTLAFLENHLGGTSRDLERAAGVACRVATRAAAKAPATPQDFLEILSLDGPARAAEVVRLAVTQRPETVVDFEAAINRAGYELLAAGRSRDAIAVLALAVEIAPESSNASDSLGEAYLAAGDLDNATRCYLDARRKLEKATGLSPEARARAAANVDRALAAIETRRTR